MTLIKSPMKGMPEQTPKIMQIREYVLGVIKNIYASFGFVQIETPAIENIENLLSKQGGENEQLIFKILKRGEKLEKAQNVEDMVDCGLRYDLTLPLARFYANNQETLPSPFKSIQIGNVWRADRPQKGRFRQFTQSDIDILGDASNLAEIDLITATYKALCALNLTQATIRINDRKILKAMADYAGFEQSQYSILFISLDKLDKIGLDGVKNDLLVQGFDEQKVQKYIALFENAQNLRNCKEFLQTRLPQIDETILNNLDEIINTCRELTNNKINIIFDPTLVRGMGYYTGTIYEISLAPYNYSIGGGGRYDEMIGKFIGQNVPACGFSLGFERIVEILSETGFEIPNSKPTKVIFIDKKCDANLKYEVLKYAQKNRKNINISVVIKNKNFYHQKEQFEKNGITDFVEIYTLEDLNI